MGTKPDFSEEWRQDAYRRLGMWLGELKRRDIHGQRSLLVMLENDCRMLRQGIEIDLATRESYTPGVAEARAAEAPEA